MFLRLYGLSTIFPGKGSSTRYVRKIFQPHVNWCRCFKFITGRFLSSFSIRKRLLINSLFKWLGLKVGSLQRLSSSTSQEFPSSTRIFSFWLNLGDFEIFSVEEFCKMELYNSPLTTEILCRVSEFFSSLKRFLTYFCFYVLNYMQHLGLIS